LLLLPIYSAIGNGSQFTSGGITKRGNRYLQKQLVHGARAVLFRSKGKKNQLNRWAHAVAERRGVPKASVALATRLARLA
jgi:transposase